jgi:sigma-B regulation protein RsbU (phosphoserine phosphatase)
MPDAKCRQVSFELDPGDTVLIYSDGVTDAQNADGERYDSTENPRLRKRLSRSGNGPKAIGQSIIQDFEDFSAGHAQFDDITLICFGPVR